jgi:hypothetical protein
MFLLSSLENEGTGHRLMYFLLELFFPGFAKEQKFENQKLCLS